MQTNSGGNLIWRRCGACSQLTLVPVSAQVCWQCGAPIDSAPPHGSPIDGSVSDWHSMAPAPADESAVLTPDEDAAANRLLASVFPHGVPL